MPVLKCSNGKYRIGSGDCVYKSKASAERAYRGYLGSTYGESSIAQTIKNVDQSRTTIPTYKKNSSTT